MSLAALDGRALGAPAFRPSWLRPAALAAVVVLHAAILAVLSYVAPSPPARPNNIVVDIEPAPSPPQAAPEPEPPREPEAAAEPPPLKAPPPPPMMETPPSPVVEAPSPEPATPVFAAPPPAPAPPPLVERPPEAASPPPIENPVPPPAPVELQRPKPAPRVEPPKDAAQIAARPKPAPVQLKRAEPQTRPDRTPKSVSPATEPAHAAAAAASAPASAASQSAYVSAIAAAIRSRLFYPPSARARGAKGVVGVTFTVGPSGALTAFAITRSSGDQDLDAAARTLVQSASFPPPPGGSAHVSTSFNYVPR